MRRQLLLLVLLGGAWFAGAPSASALGCILLGCDCSVSATDIVFDDVSPLLSTSADAQGTIDIDCTGLLTIGAGVVVELDDGVWGTFAARRMRSASGDLVSYNIYKPNQPSVVWGDGTGGSQTLAVAGGLIVLGRWQASRPVPARMTLSAATKPGAYSDTVVVRVIW